MSNDRDELARMFERGMLNSLTENDGENLRELIRYAKTSKSKKVKKDMERICRHLKLKPPVPH